jgi:hypothetical protein
MVLVHQLACSESPDGPGGIYACPSALGIVVTLFVDTLFVALLLAIEGCESRFVGGVALELVPVVAVAR